MNYIFQKYVKVFMYWIQIKFGVKLGQYKTYLWTSSGFEEAE